MIPIIGHEHIRAFFHEANTTGRLSHAYCFVGPEQVGKKAVALALASEFLGIDRERIFSHPDVTIVEREKDEKTDKTKKDISITQIRELVVALQRRSFGGGYKIAIVDDADLMNTGAANALLKTLEEPSAHTMIILTTTDDTALPGTIRSRVQTIRFAPVPNAELEQGLSKALSLDQERQAMIRYARGLPGRLIQWFNDPEAFDAYQKEVERFLSLLGRSFSDKLKIVNDLFGDKTDHIAARARLIDLMSLWQVLLRDLWLSRIGLYELQIHPVESPMVIDKDQTVLLSDELQKIRTSLEQNVHPRLLLEQFLLLLP